MKPLPDLPPVSVQPMETGNLLPLLHEIRHALQALVANGEASQIDLRALPMAPGEEQRLLDLLGQGEVRAELQALGRSEFRETRFPGVWLVTHYNTSDELMGRFVEIARVPELLVAPPEDIEEGRAALLALLESQQSTQ